MEELESKRQRIDFVFADKALQRASVSGTILISEELDQISDHYPVLVQLNLPSEKGKPRLGGSK